MSTVTTNIREQLNQAAEQARRSFHRRVVPVPTEALRAGFKECWQTGDYQTIVDMAARIKDDIIQEEPALVMYYDNALMRTEA